MADDLLNNVLGADYQEVNAVQSGNAVYKNGKLMYFKIDIDQPGKYFFDLTDAFNATVDESNKIIPLQFVRGGQPLQLNGFTISMDGKYPDMITGFSVTGKLNTSSPAFVNFALPLGMFQAVGPYRFQFTITNSNTGEVLKSPFQFFNVTESATNLAIDLNKGIEPYDSEYQNWKAKVENEINQELTTLNNLSDSADQLKALMNQYVADAEGYVESQFTKCLQKENTWTNKQHFNGGITFSGNAQGDILITNEIDTQKIKYQIPELADYGYDLESGVIVHTGALIASSTTDSSSGVSLLNGVGTNNSGNGYITFDLFKGRDYKGVCIHANCKIPQSAVGKPIVQLPGGLGLDQTPFRLGDYVVRFDMTSNVLFCLGYMNNSNQGNDICQDVVTIL